MTLSSTGCPPGLTRRSSRRSRGRGRFAHWAALFGLLAGCGGSAALAPRAYERSGLETVPLRSVALVAIASPPVGLDDANIDVDPYPPPRADALLDAGRPVSPQLSSALGSAIEAELEALGYTVRRPASPRGGGELSLRDLRASAGADALLVVRAVPLEPVYVLEETVESQVIGGSGEQGGGIQLPQRVAAARLRPGRLFLGQLFLFDAKTGARLWSRQLPGLPSDRTLRPDTELLGFGLTGPEARGADQALLTARSSAAFARSALRGFPEPSPGTEAGTAMLAGVDVAAEARREGFFDEQHLVIEIGTGWTFERIEGQVVVPTSPTAEVALPDLETGAFAPSGGIQALQARIVLVTPGGLTFNGFGVVGTIPASFQRRVYVETETGADVLGAQSVEGGLLFGGGAGIGQLFALSEALFLHPSALVYAEQWSYDVLPLESFEASNHVRIGLEARLDLWWVLFGGPLFVRVGAHGRTGIDTVGPTLFGGGGSLGVGVML